jgi:hypothetical protein
MRQPRGLDVVEDGDDKTRRFVREDFRRIRRGRRRRRTKQQKRDDGKEHSGRDGGVEKQQQREQQSALEHGSGVQKFKNDAAAADDDERDDGAFVVDDASVFASVDAKLDDGAQSVVFIFVAGESENGDDDIAESTDDADARGERAGRRARVEEFVFVLRGVEGDTRGGDECSFRAYDDFCLDVVRGEQQQQREFKWGWW